MSRADAATRVQAAWRGYEQRAAEHTWDTSATKIQRCWRSSAARVASDAMGAWASTTWDDAPTTPSQQPSSLKAEQWQLGHSMLRMVAEVTEAMEALAQREATLQARVQRLASEVSQRDLALARLEHRNAQLEARLEAQGAEHAHQLQERALKIETLQRLLRAQVQDDVDEAGPAGSSPRGVLVGHWLDS